MEMTAAINGVVCEVLCRGTMKFNYKIEPRIHFVSLNNDLCSPKLLHNLMAGHLSEEKRAIFGGKNGRIDFF